MLNIGFEIERKYLLKKLPNNIRSQPAFLTDTLQGYLSGGDDLVETRVRATTLINAPKDHPKKQSLGVTKYYYCVKAGEMPTRIEAEQHITKERFDRFWDITEGKRISKYTFKIPSEDDGIYWEIAEFGARGLCMAEIEIPHENWLITFPDWLEPYIDREVTLEKEYKNYYLAR